MNKENYKGNSLVTINGKSKYTDASSGLVIVYIAKCIKKSTGGQPVDTFDVKDSVILHKTGDGIYSQ